MHEKGGESDGCWWCLLFGYFVVISLDVSRTLFSAFVVKVEF